jgi:tRNA threonylcarbamoyladenosine biosynthesis protein TsaE
MSTGLIWQTKSMSSDATMQLAEQVGRRLRGGEVIELVSDLGGGKTTFVKGLAKGMGSNDLVSSPSFTINNIYSGTGIKLHHYDFYRLHEPGIMKQELAEALTDPNTVAVIEWAAIAQSVLPEERLTISFTPVDEDSREISFQAPRKLKYLFPDHT